MNLLIEALQRAEDNRHAPTSPALGTSPPRLELEPLDDPPSPTRTTAENQGPTPATHTDHADGTPPPAAYPHQALLAGLAGSAALMALAIGIWLEMRPLSRAEPPPPAGPISLTPHSDATPDKHLTLPPGGPKTPGPFKLAEPKPAALPPVAGVATPEGRPVVPAHPETANATAIRLERTTPSSDTATALAHAAYLTHDLPRAEALYREALQATPDDSDAQRGLGTILALQQRWTEARHVYAQARSLSPDDPDLTYDLAVTFDQAGQFKAAATHYRLALALATRHPARFNVAEGHARLLALTPQEPSP